MVAILVISGLLLTIIASLFATTGLLLLGARWARIPGVRFRTALLAMMLSGIAGGICQVLASTSQIAAIHPVVALALSLAGFVAIWITIQHTLGTSLPRAILAWLPTLSWSLGLFGAMELVVKPMVLDTYIVTSNAMAPTIVGAHFETNCPECGGTLYVSATGFPRFAPNELGICSGCLKSTELHLPPGQPMASDRIVSVKLLSLRRWDLITFHSPADPRVVFVKRLVGLPGESVAIRDGEVWINGQVATKPPSIAALKYVASPSDEAQESWGPVTLAEGEYLVLGDFSQRSADSRIWDRGAPGHPPYAVPSSHVAGVVTLIYWPPSRWRIFR